MAKKANKVAAKGKVKVKASVKPIAQYEHLDKERVNNPHIGLVNESTDTEYGQNKKMYQYDPHLDPQTNEEKLAATELPKGSKVFRLGDLTSQDPPSEPQPFTIDSLTFHPSQNRHWSVKYPDGIACP
jgi:hypothetical protein